ncbi:MAG TPA: hypothetical protein VNH83_21675, partial [Bryobacteraceae bacterium]|nr:hypothetical protein [Bryobacteraceae bacterium]
EQTTTAPEFYTWTFPGAPVRIHLHLSVVERLAPEVRRACDVVPTHSVEIGGLLLGTADFKSSPVVEIKDFVPFLCEYRSDHKFILSDANQRKLEETLTTIRNERADGLAVVGFYRSHIGAGLSLNESDLALAEAHFYDPADVFLLVKPSSDGSSTAGFFFWDNGRIDSEFTFLEFPFDPRLLTGARVNPTILGREPEGTEFELPASPRQFVTQPAVGSVAQIPRVQERRRATSRLPWLWYPLFTILMIALGAVGYQALLKWTGPGSGEAPATTVASDAPVLALRVERKDNDLRVSWNRKAEAVVHAKEAALSIRDGDAQQQELRLTPEQLRYGSVLYTPANGSVQFRLEVTAPDNSKTGESVLALTAPKAPAAASTKTSVALPPTRANQPAGNSAQDGKGVTNAGSERDFGEPVRLVTVDPPSQAPDASGQNQAPSSDPLPPAPRYVAARPIRQTQPVLPAAVRKLIATLVEVDVKVRIGETGRVVQAEPLPSGELVSSSLVEAARAAAMLWRFVPAQRDNQPVPSDLVLKFQFRPAFPQ